MPLFNRLALAAILISSNQLSSANAELTQVCPNDDGERFLRGISSRDLATSTFVNNGVIMLGVHDEGHLNVSGGVSDGHDGSTTVGLRFFRDGKWYDSTAYGCKCEGFGVSARVVGGSSFWGGANRSVGGVTSLSPSSIVSDGTTATSYAQVTSGPLAVKHEFVPSGSTANLYEVKVTMINTSSTQTLTELRYRRAMDWDIPPTPFNECVSIFYGSQPKDLEYTTDDGFEDSNPLVDRSTSGRSFSCPTGGSPCPVYDSGPSDHGAMFQFLFKNDDSTLRSLAPGESYHFTIFYGAAANKLQADAAIAAAGAEIASYGYPPKSIGCNTSNDGSPGVYIFGFGQVGADPIFTAPPSTSSAPSASPTHDGVCEVSLFVSSTIQVPHRNNCYNLGVFDGGELSVDWENKGCKSTFVPERILGATDMAASTGNSIVVSGEWEAVIDLLQNSDPTVDKIVVNEIYKNSQNHADDHEFHVELTLPYDCVLP